MLEKQLVAKNIVGILIKTYFLDERDIDLNNSKSNLFWLSLLCRKCQEKLY